jgi:hypothetical protein
MGKKIDEEGSDQDFRIIREAFHLSGADNQLNIVFNKPDDKLKDYLLEWLK